MTRIFTAGAEEFDANSVWNKLDVIGGSGEIYDVQRFGKTSYLNTNPRTGRGLYQVQPATSLFHSFGVDQSKTELFFGFAANHPSFTAGHFFYAYTDDPDTWGNYVSIRPNSSGALDVTRTGTSIATSVAGVIVANQWQYYEVWIKPLNSLGRIIVKVDGVTVIDFTGDTTNEEEFINGFKFTGNAVSALPSLYDDIVVNDADGAVNNTYPGMVRLLPIRPDAPGTNSDWTRAGVDMGTDEAQLRNGTFEFSMLQTASADALQDAIPEIPDLPAGATITNIVLTANAKVDAGAGVIAPMVIANGTSDISADQTLITNWRHYQYAWAVNPDDSAAWEEADLSLLKIGVSS